MNELKLLVEALDKAVKMGVYNNLEIATIHSCIGKVSNELKPNEVEDDSFQEGTKK